MEIPQSRFSGGDHTFQASDNSLTLHYHVVTCNSSSTTQFLIVQPPPWGLGRYPYLLPQFTKPLLQHFSLIFLTPRGTAPSDRPTDPSHMSSTYIVEDLESLRQHLDLDHINLFGHSSGATITLGYALRYPTKINKVICACAYILGYPTKETRYWDVARAAATKLFPPFINNNSLDNSHPSSANASSNQPEKSTTYQTFITSFFNAHPPRTNSDFQSFFIEIAPAYLSPTTQDSVTETLRRVFRESPPQDIWACEKYFVSDLEEGWDQIEDLQRFAEREVTGKVLVVCGRDDVTCEVGMSEMAVEVGNGKGKGEGEGDGRMELRVIEECGHFPWLERREEWWRIVERFLVG